MVSGGLWRALRLRLRVIVSYALLFAIINTPTQIYQLNQPNRFANEAEVGPTPPTSIYDLDDFSKKKMKKKNKKKITNKARHI